VLADPPFTAVTVKTRDVVETSMRQFSVPELCTTTLKAGYCPAEYTGGPLDDVLSSCT
jgi:hypothetical protein